MTMLINRSGYVVRGVIRLQYHSGVKDTAICERDKSAECNKGEPGVEAEFWDDVCVGLDGEILRACKGREEYGVDWLMLNKNPWSFS